MSEFSDGQVFELRYPMVLETVSLFDEEGPIQTESWRPGTRWAHTSPYGDAESYADGEGKMLLTVVSMHKPGKYPERVFFTRKFVSPVGREFGSSKLRMATIQTFRRLTKGFRYEYEVLP